MRRRFFAFLGVGLFSIVASGARADSGSVVQGSLSPDVLEKVQLVYVEHVDGTFAPKTAVMGQKGNTYRPHVLPVLVGSTVEFQSQDPELHNVFARGADHHVMFNQAVLPHMKMSQIFAKPGVVKLTCNVHKTMLAFVPVLQNPYWAQPGKDGSWKIEGLPPGQYQVRIWGEELDDSLLGKSFPVEVTGPTQSQTLKIAAN
jgi:plastocyanin